MIVVQAETFTSHGPHLPCHKSPLFDLSLPDPAFHRQTGVRAVPIAGTLISIDHLSFLNLDTPFPLPDLHGTAYAPRSRCRELNMNELACWRSSWHGELWLQWHIDPSRSAQFHRFFAFFTENEVHGSVLRFIRKVP